MESWSVLEENPTNSCKVARLCIITLPATKSLTSAESGHCLLPARARASRRTGGDNDASAKNPRRFERQGRSRNARDLRLLERAHRDARGIRGHLHHRIQSFRVVAGRA